MEHGHRQAFRHLLVIADVVSIVIAMVLAMSLHAALREQFGGFKAPPSLDRYLLLAYLTLPMWLAIGATLGVYRHFEQPVTVRRAAADLLKLNVCGLFGLALLNYVTQINMNRSVVALFVLLTYFLMLSTRAALYFWIRFDYRNGHHRQNLLLICDAPESIAALQQRFATQAFPPRLIGCLVPETVSTDWDSWPIKVLGHARDVGRVLRDQPIDLVLVSCRREVFVDIDALLEACDELGVVLRCHVRADHRRGHKIRVTEGHGIPLIAFDTWNRPPGALLLKRALDVLISSVALIVLSPILLITCVAVRVSMGSPIFIRQTRAGYNGRTFVMYKFRTMIKDAEQQRADLERLNEIGGPVFKIYSDPRITPLGRLLRRASVDELPQLYNVLQGSMSLVGPRPLIVGEQDRIRGPERRRLSMKPGMTGLWQVSGRSNLRFDEWMKLDLEYVDNWSLRLDFRLLLKTVPAVLTGRGAV